MTAPGWRAAIQRWLAAGSEVPPERVIWGNQNAPRPSSSDGPWISILELGETSGGGDWVVTERRVLAVALNVTAVDAGANTLTVGNHGRATGDGPVRLTTTGTLPGGLEVDTDYWILRVDATRIRLAATFLDAMESPTPVELTDAGTGAHSLVGTAVTVRAGAEITRTVEGTRTVTLSVQCFGGPSVDANGAGPRLKRTVAALSLPSVQAALRAANVGIASVNVTSPQNTGAVHQVAGFEPRATMTVTANVPIVDVSETGTVIESVQQTGTVT